MKKLIVLLPLLFSSQVFGHDLSIEKVLKGTATLLLLEQLHKQQNTHILPRSSYGIYYEPADGRGIARTHCPIREQITIYNRYGKPRDYNVRDCRR